MYHHTIAAALRIRGYGLNDTTLAQLLAVHLVLPLYTQQLLAQFVDCLHYVHLLDSLVQGGGQIGIRQAVTTARIVSWRLTTSVNSVQHIFVSPKICLR